MKAIILAAGNGTRMAPLGLTTPKLLIPIQNRTILDWHMDAISAHVDEVIIVVGPDTLSQKIRDYVASKTWPVPIAFAVQQKPLGTANAIQSAAELAKDADRILCLNGDDLYSSQDINTLVNYDFAVLGQPVEDWPKWGILSADSNGQLIELIEKPDHFMGNLAYTGAALLNSKIFNLYHHVKPSSRGEYEFTETVTAFAKIYPVMVQAVTDFWLPIGYPWHILDAQEALADRFDYRIDGIIEENVSIRGQLSLGHNSIIKSGCYFEGRVIIGDNCEIGPNAYLRGTTVIGSDSKIGFSCEINNSVLFGQTKIPHFNFIGNSVLGYNARFAAGAATADRRFDRAIIKTPVKGQMIETGRAKFGTIMGDNTYLGCNAIINPGKKIWPNINVMPGQIVNKDITE